MVDNPKVVCDRIVRKRMENSDTTITSAKKKKDNFNGKFTFLVPKNFSTKEMGKSFQQIGNDMDDEKNIGKKLENCHKCTTDYTEIIASLTEKLVRSIICKGHLLWEKDTDWYGEIMTEITKPVFLSSHTVEGNII